VKRWHWVDPMDVWLRHVKREIMVKTEQCCLATGHQRPLLRASISCLLYMNEAQALVSINGRIDYPCNTRRIVDFPIDRNKCTWPRPWQLPSTRNSFMSHPKPICVFVWSSTVHGEEKERSCLYIPSSNMVTNIENISLFRPIIKTCAMLLTLKNRIYLILWKSVNEKI